jgi:methionyl-tRNA formyltransferase
MSKHKFIFIGTSEFAAIILENFIKKGLVPSLVITQPDKKQGRKQILTSPPVRLIAQKYKIPIEQPVKIDQIKNKISDVRAEFILVAAYGQILPKSIIESPTLGSLNIHASLLPTYRGPSPIQEAIIKGDKKTGITIIKMDEKIDHGPVLAKEKILIDRSDTFITLSQKLANLGNRLVFAILPQLLSNKIQPRPQDEKRVTYTNIIKKNDGLISWSEKAVEIERKVRAYITWPSAYTLWQGKLLKILEADIYPDNFNLDPGRVFKTEKGEIAITTSEKALIIKKLQVEGKVPVETKEFLKGYPQIIGGILGK